MVHEILREILSSSRSPIGAGYLNTAITRRAGTAMETRCIITLSGE